MRHSVQKQAHFRWKVHRYRDISCWPLPSIFNTSTNQRWLANDNLRQMELAFARLFKTAQQAGDIGPDHDPDNLARKYQSDLLGLRMSAERSGVDAQAIAKEIADGLDRL